MSKKANHWYLLAATVQAWTKLFRPRARQIALWLALAALFLIAFETGALEGIFKHADSPAFVPVFTVVVTGVALGIAFAVARWRRSVSITGYVKALQHPGPEKLVAEIARSMRSAWALPDGDAFGAQARAIAYALYGRGDDAMQLLATVDWSRKAPLIQAVGLSAEGIIELLCRRDVERALELNRKARSMASISAVLPGAKQSERYHGTCIAVSEVLLNTESPTSLKWLEESASDRRFPPLRLIACFGLAIASDRGGDGKRGNELRTFLREIAPHCEPLHLLPADFAASGRARPASCSFSVSSALPSGEIGGAAAQERVAKKKLVRAASVLVGLWVVLILMFLAIWTFLAPAK